MVIWRKKNCLEHDQRKKYQDKLFVPELVGEHLIALRLFVQVNVNSPVDLLLVLSLCCS